MKLLHFPTGLLLVLYSCVDNSFEADALIPKAPGRPTHRRAWERPRIRLEALRAVGEAACDLPSNGAKAPRGVYGEESRRYRRTRYEGPEDWVNHRSTTRIFSNLGTIFTSGVVRSLQVEVGAVTAVAIALIAWNSIASHGIAITPEILVNPMTLPALSLPALPFTLSSPALGLLLVFRTNASYTRWLEARKVEYPSLSRSHFYLVWHPYYSQSSFFNHSHGVWW